MSTRKGGRPLGSLSSPTAELEVTLGDFEDAEHELAQLSVAVNKALVYMRQHVQHRESRARAHLAAGANRTRAALERGGVIPWSGAERRRAERRGLAPDGSPEIGGLAA